MPGDIETQVRELLKPTFDETGWYQAVMALDRAAAVPVLARIVAADAEEARARRQAALILGLLADPRAVEALTAALGTGDGTVRGYAAAALGRIPALPDDAARRLVAALGDDDAFVRESAAKSLGRLQHPDALEPLERMAAADPYEANRPVAAEAARAVREAV